MQAKKKGQQDKAAGKLAQAASSSAAQPWKSSQADSSQSEEEEERERFSLQDSRFASLVGDTTPSAGPGGSGVGDPNPSLGQGLQRLQPSSTHATAAGSTAADSGNEEEGEHHSNRAPKSCVKSNC